MSDTTKNKNKSAPRLPCYICDENIDGNETKFDPRHHRVCLLCVSKVSALTGYEWEWRGTLYRVEHV